MPVVTALRERRGSLAARNARPDRETVDVELDGAPWRALPLDVVVRTSLRVGLELDRGRLRELRRELRRAEALGTAVRALRRRDLPRARLEARLAERGIAAEPAAEAVDALARAGYVDDTRFAQARAQALATRSLGDEAIRWDLERQGVSDELARAAIASLEPEGRRAQRVVAARGATPATARFLARKGFSEDSVEGALGPAVADEA